MKVILLKDIKNLGKSGDIVEVKNGYGRNFLLAKNLAKLATGRALKNKEKDLMRKKSELEILEGNAKKILKEIEKKPLEFKLKKTPKEKTFGSIGVKKIEEVLKNKYPEIEKLKLEISLKEPIKKFGEFLVGLTLMGEIKGNIKIVVKEEK